MTGDSSITVLCVDDEPGMADLIGEYLERADDRLTTTAATSAPEGLRLLDAVDPDCVVSDYDMAGADGLVFLESVRSARPDLPFVLFTGYGSEEIASAAISAGVTDYMRKEPGTDQYRVLARRIRNAVARSRARAEAAEAERRAETILDTSPDAVVVTVGGTCEYANPAAVDLLGVADAAALRGRALSAFFPRATGEHLRAIRTGEVDPTRLQRTARTADGRSVPVEVTARRIPWDGETGVVSVVRDVSDRIERERELAYRQSLLDSLFELSPNGLLITDDTGGVLTYNDRFADLWGLPRTSSTARTASGCSIGWPTGPPTRNCSPGASSAGSNAPARTSGRSSGSSTGRSSRNTPLPSRPRTVSGRTAGSTTTSRR